jgi:hypothetical protein
MNRLNAMITAAILVAAATAVSTVVGAEATSVGADLYTLPHFLKVGDMVQHAPPAPPGTSASELKGQALRDHVIANLKVRFDAAADPSTHLLTIAQAKHAGWGYVVDHFKEIDRSNSGYISFDDLCQYLKSRKGPAFSTGT